MHRQGGNGGKINAYTHYEKRSPRQFDGRYLRGEEKRPIQDEEDTQKKKKEPPGAKTARKTEKKTHS